MKRKNIWILLSSLLLVSCQRHKISSPVSSFGSSRNSDSSQTISLSDHTSQTTSKPSEVTVFAINDLHGSLEMGKNYGEPGLARLEYAIKHDSDYQASSSLIISSGDSWQGGYLSYEEKTLTDELLDMMGVKAMTIGNHEFDWGIETLEKLCTASPFPILGANVKNLDGVRPSFLKASTTVDVGAVKYGIIGAIGADLEDDIDVQSLGGYSFSSELNLLQDETKKLKAEGCDVIFLSVHDDFGSDYVQSISQAFSTSEIAGIFGGHSHRLQNVYVNAIPYVQGGCNSYGYSKMTFQTKDQQLVRKSYVDLRKGNYYFNLQDEQLNGNIVARLKLANQKHHGDLPIATCEGNFERGYELRKLIPDAMVSVADSYGWGNRHSGNELIAIHNTGGIRANLYSGPIGYKEIFKVSPFDNEVKVIENIPGTKIASLLGNIKNSHSSDYYAFSTQSDAAFDSSKVYDVVTIDYVSMGNYWNKAIGHAEPQHDLDKDNNQPVYARDTIIKFMLSHPEPFKAKDYRY